MRRKKEYIFVLTLVMSTIFLMTNISSACTAFTTSENDLVLVGANEDWWDPDPYIRFQPATNKNYGYMMIECIFPLPWDPEFLRPFTGLNDQGLFLDFFVTPELWVSFDLTKPLLLKDPTSHFMEKCSTVSDVVEFWESYNLFFLNFLGLKGAQMFIADKNGNSAIIEGDDIIYKENDFQVVTNFLQSHPELGNYPCWRYDTAVDMLENMTVLSDDFFRSILSETYQESYCPTQYSGVYDLNQQIIYLNHYQDYEKTIEIDLQTELSQGEHTYHLPSLFEPENNQPPIKPDIPVGPTTGSAKTDYTYKVNSTTDPDNEEDEIYYMFDWDDGTYSVWLNKAQVDYGSAFHAWNKPGNYDVRVKAKDIYGKESEWSDPLQNNMPRSRLIRRPFFQFLKSHPRMFPLLQQLLRL
jgi:choloylglycine hydrolase